MKNKVKYLLMFAGLTLVISGCSYKTTTKESESQATYEAAYSTYSVDAPAQNEKTINEEKQNSKFDYNDVPEYNGVSYVEINGNTPFFTDDEIVYQSYEDYGVLDSMGRCTVAIACLSKETMPAEGEERGEIGSIKPSGWKTVKYDCVDGNYLYNRCHIIGWQLGAENANELNLITGTRYMNLQMLEYENLVANYIRNTGNHVMYRVTPVFIEDELVCRGLLMEGKSVENEEISYCVFFYNVQPGIDINYKTGESNYTGVFLDTVGAGVKFAQSDIISNADSEATYILNTRSMKFHNPDCDSVSEMSEKNKREYIGSRAELLNAGYSPCGRCNP